ncbi:hypothetical protein [Acetobacterium wieringae]|uniref:hypothetical protein n=1 Tax=Acetobacterium wieringae TaxID=52694 RepID=UPI003158242E
MIEYIAIGISILAVILAFWQGYLSKQQPEQAKHTKSETDKLLDEIKTRVTKVESISDETRKDVKNQISKLIDKQDENFKVLLNAPTQNSQNEMILALLPTLLQNPESMKTMIDLANIQNGRK